MKYITQMDYNLGINHQPSFEKTDDFYKLSSFYSPWMIADVDDSLHDRHSQNIHTQNHNRGFSNNHDTSHCDGSFPKILSLRDSGQKCENERRSNGKYNKLVDNDFIYCYSIAHVNESLFSL